MPEQAFLVGPIAVANSEGAGKAGNPTLNWWSTDSIDAKNQPIASLPVTCFFTNETEMG